ncbi:MAG: electron transport complex subunit RsxC [Bacteroidales bacterium]|nr:electron transport complex subunit RsxC [Candidatus Colimorpha onthohippi]
MLKTFAIGGIHPSDNKLAANQPIEYLPLPQQVVVMMSQHIGAPAVSLVEPGDKVLVGQLIGEGKAFMSANIHSPVSGVVTKVDMCRDIAGMPKPAVYINVEGDEWLSTIDRSPEIKYECNLDPSQVFDKIKEMGIVGLGGATFPTHIKYAANDDRNIDYLIVNGVECEPYLTADSRLLVEHATEICIAIDIVRQARGIAHAAIGIEANKPEAIALMTQVAGRFESLEVVPLKMKYPQGAEKQLIYAITHRRVPSGKLPIDVGCIISNAGTMFAIYEALQKNKPLFERVVTVTGKGVKTQHNYKVRVGTSIKSLVEFSIGEIPGSVGKIISGGPMMGKAIFNLDAPTTKGMGGVLIMNESESVRQEETTCIRCGKCLNACPMGLEPYLFSALVRHERYAEARQRNILDCIECGSCAYSCPAHKPLTSEIRLGKAKVRAMMPKK